VILKDEVFRVIGCAIEVLNTLGHGLVEKPYEKALVVEFNINGIPFRQQPAFDIVYKGHTVGLFIPDLIAFESVVVDTKVIERITDHERGLMFELSANNEAACGCDSQLQTREARMGTTGFMNSCPFVLIRG